MGRASKKKPKQDRRSPQPADPSEATSLPQGKGRGWLVPLAVATLAVGGIYFVSSRDAGLGGGPDTSQWSVPDVVTGDMLAPVARVLGEARDAVLEDPSSAAAWGELATLLDAHEFYPEAGEAYGRALELEPRDFTRAYLRAVVLDLQGAELPAVEAAFERALALNAEFPPAFFRFGDALVRQGQPEKARTAFERAIELDPDFVRARRSLGQVLLRLGEAALAVEHLERARELAPDDAVVHANLAQAYRAQGQEALAEESLRASEGLERDLSLPDPLRFAVERRSLIPSACQTRVQENLAQREFALALRDLVVLEEVYPEDALVQYRLGLCHHRLGDAARAKQHLSRAIALDAGSIEAHLLLAGIHEMEGRMDLAIEQTRRALREEPRNLGLHKRLAMALGVSGDLEGAVAAFERAVELGLGDAEVFHNLGTARNRLGDAAGAEQALRSALEHDPENPDTLLNLGVALEDQGRVEEALGVYRRVAGRHPEHAAAQRLAELQSSGG